MFARLSYRSANRLLAVLLVAGLIPAFGCGADEQIRTYTVAKPAQTSAAVATETSAAVPVDAAQTGKATDRMLVAILPAGDRAAFFKVVGPAAAVEEREKELNEFFSNLKVGNDGRPTWTVPSGWNEDVGTGMRMATLRIPSEGKPLEMSVTALGWGGEQRELLENVNRWRKQMKLAPIGPQQLGEDTREIKAGDATITVVDLSGQYAGGPAMMAPFAGGGARSELPAGHPPTGVNAAAPRSASPNNAAATGMPKFEAPKSWRSVPASGMRKAVFAIGDEQHGGLVTLIDFPTGAGAMIADPLSNVNRWRREVGLAEIQKDQLNEVTESIEIDGKPAKYVRLIPDSAKAEESQADRATLAAMVTAGKQVWFIKLIGHRDVVQSEEENFKSFLNSMRFAEDRGAPDGDK
jgi:hypothetical protein